MAGNARTVENLIQCRVGVFGWQVRQAGAAGFADTRHPNPNNNDRRWLWGSAS